MAAQCGKMEVCNTLLKMRADANATDVVRKTVVNSKANTSLHLQTFIEK